MIISIICYSFKKKMFTDWKTTFRLSVSLYYSVTIWNKVALLEYACLLTNKQAYNNLFPTSEGDIVALSILENVTFRFKLCF